MDVQEIPEDPAFTFFGTMQLTEDLKKSNKIVEKFFLRFLVI